jgi:hypothetical protein
VDSVTFAAVAIDRLPNYGPEETNVATMMDKQIQLESAIGDIATKVELMSASSSSCIVLSADAAVVKRTDDSITSLGSELRSSTTGLQTQITQLSIICGKLAESVQSWMSSPISKTSRQQDDIDRTRNIIVSGIPEDRDRDIWMNTVKRALGVSAGRAIAIEDAFRIGGHFSPTRKRPILVRLSSVWDRRVVVSSARKLAEIDEFRDKMFINADETIEVRRQNMLKRLQTKAQRDGKTAIVSPDGLLIVNDVPIFSLKNGFVRVAVTNVTSNGSVDNA